MPPRAGRRAQPASKRAPKRPARGPQGREGDPDPFRELLAQAEGDGHNDAPSRPLKRRRVAARPATFDEAIRPEILPSDLDTASEVEGASGITAAVQTVTRDSDSESGSGSAADSDDEFEDVAFDGGSGAAAAAAAGPPDVKDVSVTIQERHGHTPRRAGATRRGIGAAERQMRLDVHKVDLCCLLYHNFVRNSYCNDHLAQATLLGLLSKKVRAMLVPRQDYPQSRRTALFMDGLNAVNDLWKTEWRIANTGIRRPRWASSPEELKDFRLGEQVEVSLDRPDFRRAAKRRAGSADLGAQLLCALLRSAGVAARLVCSLQPLTFVATAAGSTPRKVTPQKVTVYATTSDDDGVKTDGTAATAPSSKASPEPVAGPSAVPRRIARLGQSRPAAGTGPDLGKSPAVVAPNVKRISRPSYPLYWVEAFDEARQKWIAIDSLATQTVGKPSRLEPPFNDPVNAMTYVIAFESDGSARDVTRRYTRAYNAKTRRLRVESTDGGERWLRRAMKLFRRRRPLDRDSIEDAELARKEAAEGMPRSVQDFKNHPYYVLERHLRHNEVMHPRTEVGKVNSGGAANGRLESVYRRRDVHVVRSADKWYRLGREVKAREQPLKHGRPRKPRPGASDDQEGEESEVGVALYAVFQTEMYVPPPVVRGKVPRNAYGNLDVYVPSMVPLGGVHVRSRDAARAARALGIDYADAVTGFKFQGRQGTAVIEGVVVAEEHADALTETIAGFEDARAKAAARKRSAELLRLWRRFVVGLRVVERLQEYEREGDGDGDEDGGSRNIQDEIDRDEAADAMMHEGGGFFMDEDDAGAGGAPMTMHAGAIAEAFPYEDVDDARDAADTRRYSLLPDGAELVGFEGVELKPVQRPVRRLLALEDSDEEHLQAQWERPSGSAGRQQKAHTHDRVAQAEGDLAAVDQGGSVVADASVSHGGSQRSQMDLSSVNATADHAEHASPSLDHGLAEANAHTTNNEAEDTASVGGGGFLDEPDEDSEKGSLLSHDPEDEDADPEWLED